jgi:GTP-binding protein
MIIKSSEFITSAVSPDQYPPPDLPEIAFAGRSNVGKSSLINTLIRRKRLVKTSSTPGRTQLINFFRINDVVQFVDLPGYGYAKVPRAVQKKWGPMVETYLTSRESLRAVVLIIDIRRLPGAEELNLLDWLRLQGIAVILVATKADKLSKTKLRIQHQRLATAIETAPENIALFSAKSRLGRSELWQKISAVANLENQRKEEGATSS